MDLYVMRHADAVDGGSDFARELSCKGRKQAERMGDWIKAMKPGPLRIVSSPLVRARETADIVSGRLGDGVGGIMVQQDERLACGMSPIDGSALVHEFGEEGGALMLVGHAPDLGGLVSHLIGAENGCVEMRKGAVACLETVRAGAGGSVLRWLINPKLQMSDV